MKATVFVEIAALTVLAFPAGAFQATQAGIVRKVRTDMAFVQKDSPLQVMGMRSSIYDLAEQVHVANVSGKTIVRAQLGWTVDGCGKAPARAAFVGLPMDLNLAPGQWTTVGRQGITLTDTYRVLNELKEACGEAVLGVVYVEFADGSKWSYSLVGKNRFETTESPEILERLSQPLREMREKSSGGQTPPQAKTHPQACSAWSRLVASVRSWLAPMAVYAAPALWVCDPYPLRYCQSGIQLCDHGFCAGGGCPYQDCVIRP